VLSSDRHTVKPYLDAHLGLSPPAPDLATQGYPLVGGRVEVIGQQPVPTLVYRHNEHTISVVARPGTTAAAAPKPLASGGYNMVEWSGDGFAFTAVSDLEPDELRSFVADYVTATRSP
jgi:anti-sigma factor RsiW